MGVLLLVRHGQASFGSRDYDRLSQLGHEQSRILGRQLAARNILPKRIIRGNMRRHAQTATGILEGFGQDLPVEVNDGWDEFDFLEVIRVFKPLYRSQTLMKADLARTLRPRAAFQALFEQATGAWISGERDDEYEESWPDFTSRVLHALAAAGDESGVTLVVSSGGPIGWASAHLLGGGASQWSRLNRTTVNTGVTKVITGSTGTNLVTFNEHTHLERDRDMITYR